MKDEILRGLNPGQLEAVTHTGGPLLILAGAGSGKTTVLTRRIAYLIAGGVHPSSILAITFTNKAAQEMKDRIRALCGSPGEAVWAMTFHSACVRILRRELPKTGRSARFSIFDAQDQLKVMKAVLKELDLSDKRYPPKAILGAISSAKDELVGPDEYVRRKETFYEHQVARAYSLYQAKLKEQNAMDFDDLIMETVLMFSEYPLILQAYQERFQHILVDEYQDTNRAQYELTRLLASGHRRITVVGDDDQSIYTFRGADLRNILEFEKDYPSCRTVKLEENYRSTQVILEGANHVVANNAYRKEKRLRSCGEKGTPITVLVAGSGEGEAYTVANEIETLWGTGLPYSSFAILYRTHAQSREFEEVFVRRGIPYRVLAGYRFYERKHIKDATCYLRVIAHPEDLTAFERVVNEPSRGLGPAAVKRILGHAKAQGMDLFRALKDASSIKGLNSAQKLSAASLGQLLSRLAESVDETPPSEILTQVLHGSGYWERLEDEGTQESQARLDDLQELVRSLEAFEESGAKLSEYLEYAALTSDQDAYDPHAQACIMGTFHSAKGLEFDVVFLVGMEEGTLPHARSSDDEVQLEEERRLMYVGMTRAKKLLYLTLALSRRGYRGPSQTSPSRFLSEIPPELTLVKPWVS